MSMSAHARVAGGEEVLMYVEGVGEERLMGRLTGCASATAPAGTSVASREPALAMVLVRVTFVDAGLTAFVGAALILVGYGR